MNGNSISNWDRNEMLRNNIFISTFHMSVIYCNLDTLDDFSVLIFGCIILI